MKRRTLPYLECRKGRYWYFVRRSTGQLVRLPDPDDPEFHVAYARALHFKHVQPGKLTFAALIEEYRRSDRYTKLKASTRKIYEPHIRFIAKNVGGFHVPKFERRHVVEMKAALQDQKAAANTRIALLSVMMEVAIDLGWIERNPVKGMKYYALDVEHARPWSRDLQERFRREATGTTLLFFELALWTGQRANDVLSFKWSDLDGDVMQVKQQKTGTRVFLPLSGRLMDVLAQTPKTGFYIINEGGKRIAYNTMYRRVRKLLTGLGVEGVGIHGLRATAARDMAAAGKTDEEIMAVTGHKRRSSIDGYTGDERQKARAVVALRDRENGR